MTIGCGRGAGAVTAAFPALVATGRNTIWSRCGDRQLGSMGSEDEAGALNLNGEPQVLRAAGRHPRRRAVARLVRRRALQHVLVPDCLQHDGRTAVRRRALGPMVTRGVLLDVVASRGASLGPEDVIAADDLAAAAERAGVSPEPGDAMLIHTGWVGRAGSEPGTYYAGEPCIDLSAGEVTGGGRCRCGRGGQPCRRGAALRPRDGVSGAPAPVAGPRCASRGERRPPGACRGGPHELPVRRGAAAVGGQYRRSRLSPHRSLTPPTGGVS